MKHLKEKKSIRLQQISILQLQRIYGLCEIFTVNEIFTVDRLEKSQDFIVEQLLDKETRSSIIRLKYQKKKKKEKTIHLQQISLLWLKLSSFTCNFFSVQNFHSTHARLKI